MKKYQLTSKATDAPVQQNSKNLSLVEEQKFSIITEHDKKTIVQEVITKNQPKAAQEVVVKQQPKIITSHRVATPTVPIQPIQQKTEITIEVEQLIEYHQDLEITSLPVSTMDDPTSCFNSVMQKVKSTLDQPTDKKVSQFDYRMERELRLRNNLARIQQNSQKLCTSSIENRQFTSIDLFKFWQSNKALCMNEPESISKEELVKIYLYVLGDRTPKLIQMDAEAMNYKLQIPKSQVVNPNLETQISQSSGFSIISGNLTQEFLELQTNHKFSIEVNPYLHKIEFKFLEELNKLSKSNMKIITESICVTLSKYLGIEPISRIPKVVLFLLVDSILSKACLDHKFQNQYFDLLKGVFSSSTVATILFKYQFDQNSFQEKINMIKGQTNDNELEKHRTVYGENVCKQLLIMSLDEQYADLKPRSILYSVNPDMSDDQKIYKRDLSQIYMVGLAMFSSILLSNSYVSIAYFKQYANKLFEQPSLEFYFFKQQMTLLNYTLPDLFWQNDYVLQQKYYQNQRQQIAIQTQNPSQQQRDFVKKYFNDEIHSFYLKQTVDQWQKVINNKSITQAEAEQFFTVKRLCDRIELRNYIVEIFESKIKKDYANYNARCQFDVDELIYHLSKKLTLHKNNQIYLSFKKNCNELQRSIKLSQAQQKKVVIMKVDEFQLSKLWLTFLEAGVEQALKETFSIQEVTDLGKQSMSIIIGFVIKYVVQQKAVLAGQFFQQLINLLEKINYSDQLKEYTLNSMMYNDLVQLEGSIILFETMIKKKIITIIELLQFQQRIQQTEHTISFLKKCIKNLLCVESDEDDCYPAENLDSYVQRDQFVLFVQLVTSLVTQVAGNALTLTHIETVLKWFQIDELLEQYVLLSIQNEADLKTAFATNSSFISQPKSTKIFFKLVLRTNSFALIDTLQQIKKIQSNDAIDALAVCWKDACQDDKFLITGLNLITNKVCSKVELVDIIDLATFGLVASIKNTRTYQDWK